MLHFGKRLFKKITNNVDKIDVRSHIKIVNLLSMNKTQRKAGTIHGFRALTEPCLGKNLPSATVEYLTWSFISSGGFTSSLPPQPFYKKQFPL